MQRVQPGDAQGALHITRKLNPSLSLSLWILTKIHKARGEPGVVANKIPPTISSKLLDYCREPRKSRIASGSKLPEANSPVVAEPPVQTSTRESRASEASTHRAACDYPSLKAWLRSCEDDLVRGRDSHNYTDLENVFEGHGFTRVDDITMLSPEAIMDLARGEGVNVTLALVHRVFKYAKEDVNFIQSGGKLT